MCVLCLSGDVCVIAHSELMVMLTAISLDPWGHSEHKTTACEVWLTGIHLENL